MDEPQIQITLDNFVFALTNANIAFDEEQFVFLLASGNSARRYTASPKHAKRIYMLLKSKIEEYEKANGVLKTELPKTRNESSEKPIGFRP